MGAVAARRGRLLKLRGNGQLKLSAQEQAVLEALGRQFQLDNDMEDDPRSMAMLDRLYGDLGADRLFGTLINPGERIRSGAGYPLTAREVAELCRTLGVRVDYKAVERMAKAGTLTPPVLMGSGRLRRFGYFARQVVEVLYRQQLGLKPATVEAQLNVLRGEVPAEHLLYYRGLAGVRGELVECALGAPKPA